MGVVLFGALSLKVSIFTSVEHLTVGCAMNVLGNDCVGRFRGCLCGSLCNIIKGGGMCHFLRGRIGCRVGDMSCLRTCISQ